MAGIKFFACCRVCGYNSRMKKSAPAESASDRVTPEELTRNIDRLTRNIDRLTRRSEATTRNVDKLIRDNAASRRDIDRLTRASEGHRRNLSRALENAFAASLPRAMQALGISIRHQDIRLRVRKSNHSPEFDFIAPNGELVLAGEVKTRLTRDDVVKLYDAISVEFRGMFPEYAGLPVYGVVCGGLIDDDAVHAARKRGFIVLRMEGAAIHPATGEEHTPKAY